MKKNKIHGIIMITIIGCKAQAMRRNKREVSCSMTKSRLKSAYIRAIRSATIRLRDGP